MDIKKQLLKEDRWINMVSQLQEHCSRMWQLMANADYFSEKEIKYEACDN